MKKLVIVMGMLASMLFAAPLFASDIINVNTATTQQLQKVKGIGPKTAQAIIAYREAHGDFASVGKLTAVKGIGKKKLKKIENALTVEKAKKK